MASENLTRAKTGKNDEFYTQYEDIQREVNAYLEFNPDAFRKKTILLPCDDPEWSNFTRFFAQNFEALGLKKLISTSYAADSKPDSIPYQLSFFESESPQFDENKTRSHGKIFTLTQDRNQSGKIDYEDLEWDYLEGDGDFRGEEIKKLRDEADIIVTNPPFSLFREFLAWIMEADKKFLIIGNQNVITYKEVFPLIKDNRLWLGRGFKGNVGFFQSPYQDTAVSSQHKKGFIRVSGVMWFTNIDHGRRHQPLSLMTVDDNIKFSKHKEIRGVGYTQYDNYDAIEVPFSDAIPDDYMGVMGVPITFLTKHCPEQFEIVGITKTWFGCASKVYPQQIQVDKDGKQRIVTKLNDGAVLKWKTAPQDEVYYKVEDGYYTQVYARILIKKRCQP